MPREAARTRRRWWCSGRVSSSTGGLIQDREERIYMPKYVIGPDVAIRELGASLINNPSALGWRTPTPPGGSRTANVVGYSPTSRP